MKNYFISYGTGLSSNDSKSTENIKLQFYARNDNSGWNMTINNKQLFGISVEMLTHNDDTEYYLFKDNEPYEYFQFNNGGMNNPRNLIEIAECMKKYFQNNSEIWE